MGIARDPVEPFAVLFLAVGHTTCVARLVLLTMGCWGEGGKFSPMIALTVRIPAVQTLAFRATTSSQSVQDSVITEENLDIITWAVKGENKTTT